MFIFLLCHSQHFLSIFLISPKGGEKNLWIYEYFHSSIVNSLIIIWRKWQCKQPTSEKHMNTWICKWEPLWANVLSGAVWVRAVYTVQSSCGELLFYGFCWKLSSETKNLSQGMPLNPSSFQPLFVSADLLKYNRQLLTEAKSNQYDNLYFSFTCVLCLCSPTE